MPLDIYRGIIEKLSDLSYGTVQVTLGPTDESDFTSVSLPFFGVVDRKYIGRPVDVSQVRDSKGGLHQIISGSDFECRGEATQAQQDAMWTQGIILSVQLTSKQETS